MPADLEMLDLFNSGTEKWKYMVPVCKRPIRSFWIFYKYKLGGMTSLRK